MYTYNARVHLCTHVYRYTLGIGVHVLIHAIRFSVRDIGVDSRSETEAEREYASVHSVIYADEASGIVRSKTLPTARYR